MRIILTLLLVAAMAALIFDWPTVREEATPAIEVSSVVESARGQEQIDLNNMHDGVCRCAIYFLMSAQGMRNAGLTAEAQQADDTAVYLTKFAVTLHNFETTKARMELHRKDMMSEIGGNYTNFSRLILKHNDFCGALLRSIRNR